MSDPRFRDFVSELHEEPDDPISGTERDEPAARITVRENRGAVVGGDLFIMQRNRQATAPRPPVVPNGPEVAQPLQIIERRRSISLIVGGAIAISSFVISSFIGHESMPYVMGAGTLGMLAAFAVARG